MPDKDRFILLSWDLIHVGLDQIAILCPKNKINE